MTIVVDPFALSEMTAAQPWREGPLCAGYVTGCKREMLSYACHRLGVIPYGPLAEGYQGKSIGSAVSGKDGSRSWIKISGLVDGPLDSFREAERDAAQFSLRTKPDIIWTGDWIHDDIHWRGQLMTLADSPRSSNAAWLAPDPDLLSDDWFRMLGSELRSLAAISCDRRPFTPQQIEDLIRVHVGADAPCATDAWQVGHGDLHWANLAAPRLCIFDWELWGLLPRGFDCGRLLGFSADNDIVASRVAEVFADEMRSEDARPGILAGLASVKSHIGLGDLEPSAAGPIDRLIGRVLASPVN